MCCVYFSRFSCKQRGGCVVLLAPASQLSYCLQATTSETESKGEWVAAFVGAALLFGVGIWQTLGAEKAEEFFAGYLLEQSLSVDNLFVFILVFRYFRAPKADQDKVKVLSVLMLVTREMLLQYDSVRQDTHWAFTLSTGPPTQAFCTSASSMTTSCA